MTPVRGTQASPGEAAQNSLNAVFAAAEKMAANLPPMPGCPSSSQVEMGGVANQVAFPLPFPAVPEFQMQANGGAKRLSSLGAFPLRSCT
eukprot:8798906-Karenia_brevis.AAC.1